MYATARDWAKFGQVFLNEGQWPTDDDAAAHQQVLTPEWVRFAQSPAPASKHRYGAQWWLNGAATEGQGDDAFDATNAELIWQREVPKVRPPSVCSLTRTHARAFMWSPLTEHRRARTTRMRTGRMDSSASS
jgi:CubicO group peptidase (beta-lactamase class C family)